jgi:hypothetical protein
LQGADVAVAQAGHRDFRVRNHGDQRPDPVVRGLQRAAGRLPAAAAMKKIVSFDGASIVTVQPRHCVSEPVDLAQGHVDAEQRRAPAASPHHDRTDTDAGQVQPIHTTARRIRSG